MLGRVWGPRGCVFGLLRFLPGPVGSALSTRWGARPVVMFGGVLTSIGFIVSAFARSLLHLYLGLGVLAGEGEDTRVLMGDAENRSWLEAGGQLGRGLLRTAGLGLLG